MNVHSLFPSRFLKAHDLDGKAYTLTIRAASLEDVGHGQEKETKLAIAFEKATKMMLLNRTNAMIIASLYGPETDGWIGKAVVVYSARVKAFGAVHDALRIKEQIPTPAASPQKMTEAMQEEPPIDDEKDLLDVDDGDALWEPDAPAAANQKDKLLSQAQMARIHVLGGDVFGKLWDNERPNLVAEVSDGATTSSKALTPAQADVLIKMLESELKHARNGKVAA